MTIIEVTIAQGQFFWGPLSKGQLPGGAIVLGGNCSGVFVLQEKMNSNMFI